MVEAIWTTTDKNGQTLVHLIDQRELPSREIEVLCRTHREMADAIREMVVRGAPAIGISAAFGLALGAQEESTPAEALAFANHMESVAVTLGQTRPTAVNLFWAIERMRPFWQKAANLPAAERARVLFTEAQSIKDDDIERNRKIGSHGQALLPQKATVLTHCNAGALATGGYGTALGVIRGAVEAGKSINVYADETRPYLQGARLTAYELASDGIPTTLITDSMAAMVMSQGRIDAVIVGADRIAANGDTANKVGTYGLSVLAREHGIPFYIAAPFSTIDSRTLTGEMIPIEERSAREVTHQGERRMAPEGVSVYNPAFDVTPARNITAIITERGVFSPDELSAYLSSSGSGRATS
ncbi:MAG: S-methyl-5-thioribose-1-phosphate isomerase [Leptospirillia bacterium]